MDRVVFEDLTLRQFLRLPPTKPALEYIDGKVVRKVSGGREHSLLQSLLGARLLTTARATGLGMAYCELRLHLRRPIAGPRPLRYRRGPHPEG